MTPNKFGSIIRNERMFLGIDIKNLAESVGSNPSYLSRIEGGNYRIVPNDDLVKRIARYLCIDLFELKSALELSKQRQTERVAKKVMSICRDYGYTNEMICLDRFREYLRRNPLKGFPK